MASLQTDVARMGVTGRDAAIDWRAMQSVSDDECLVLLAKAVEDHEPGSDHDSASLDEVAWLIGRLAVPIE
jgi:hypothetical protein